MHCCRGGDCRKGRNRFWHRSMLSEEEHSALYFELARVVPRTVRQSHISHLDGDTCNREICSSWPALLADIGGRATFGGSPQSHDPLSVVLFKFKKRTESGPATIIHESVKAGLEQGELEGETWYGAVDLLISTCHMCISWARLSSSTKLAGSRKARVDRS